jgi:hypothetical protein
MSGRAGSDRVIAAMEHGPGDILALTNTQHCSMASATMSSHTPSGIGKLGAAAPSGSREDARILYRRLCPATVLNMKDMADRIIDHYERHARDWDADRNLHVSPWNDKPWQDRFIAALPRAARVLDLGCGSSSPVAKYMAERGLHMTGVDSAPTLISLCRQRLPDYGS